MRYSSVDNFKMGISRLIFGVTSIVGVIIVALTAIIGWAVMPSVIDQKIAEQFKLKSGTDTWKKWSHVTLPIELKFYIFHITNPDEVEEGANPILKEFGPYVYDETRIKEDLAEKGGSVFYRQKVIYKFNAAKSYGPESDTYNVLNIAYVSLLHKVNIRAASFVSTVGSMLEDVGEKVILRGVSVKDLLFHGYNVSNFEVLSAFIPFPKEFDNWLFGLYKGKNNTDDGYYQINSGIDSTSRFGEIIQWNDKTSLGIWNTTSETNNCDMINGTDGSIFPPFITTDRVLRLFAADLCRSIYLIFDEEIEISGITAYKFIVPDEMLKGPRISNSNRCFCKKENVSECDHSGVFDVSSCRGGAPFVISLPHFLGGHSMYHMQATGLKPEEDKHRTFMLLEPNSGIILKVSKKIQLNMRTQPHEGTAFANITNMIFPVIWIDESAEIPPIGIKGIEKRVVEPIKSFNTTRWTILGLGIFFAVAGALLFFLKK